MSTSRPEMIFTINDSGNDPTLFALDTTGALRGMWRLRGARNKDWEAITAGPCSTKLEASRQCLYVGDIGDNEGTRESPTLYRVIEPDAFRADSIATLSATALQISFAEGPRDVEAMYLAPDTTLYLITKRAMRSPTGELRPAQVYAVPASAWAGRAAVARLVDSLSIVPGSVPLRTITDAALSPDGRYLAVRTYLEVYVFATDARTGRVQGSIQPSLCDVSELGESQGEGITWFGTTTKLMLSSEGRGEPLRVIQCALPK